MLMSTEEMRSIGMTEEQINAIVKQYDSSSENVKQTVDNNINNSNVVDFKNYTDSDITTLEQIKDYNKGTVVRLPDFAEGQPFIARVRRPSMLVLVKSGKIPNSLLSQATDLFKQGASSLGEENTVSDLYSIIEVVCESALVQPSYKEIKDAGLTLSDQQMMAIFSYTQQGVKALESFR